MTEEIVVTLDKLHIDEDIIHRLRFIGEQERIDELLNSIKGEHEVIDFNKIIPVPEMRCTKLGSDFDTESAVHAYIAAVNPDNPDRGIPKMTAEAYESLTTKLLNRWGLKFTSDEEPIFIGDSPDEVRKCVENVLEFGFPTLNDWLREMWGVEDNLFDSELRDGNTIIFHTDWSSCERITDMLAEMFPDVGIEYAFSECYLGEFSGRISYSYGKNPVYEYFESGSKEAYECAAELWNIDLAEKGYVFDDDKNTYVHDTPKDEPQMS